jgi:signal transduction histidine kinase
MSLSDLDNDLEAMSELVDTQVRDDPFAISLQIPGLDSLSIQPVSSGKNGGRQIGDTLMYDHRNQQYRTYRYLQYFREYRGITMEIKLFKSTTPADQLVEQVTLMMTIMVLFFIASIFVLNRFIFANLWKDFFLALEKLKEFDTVKEPLVLGEPDIEEFRELFRVLERMTKRLSEDYRELREYTDHTTHELQTPLAVIKTKTELLLQSERLGPEEMQLIHAINAGTDQLSRLNSTLAMITRIENRQYPSREKINLPQFVDHHLEMMQELIALRGIRVNRRYLDPEKMVLMDLGLANVLITNLLKNAIVHNTDQGEINLEINSKSMVISNDGPPFNFDEKKLFRRFTRNVKMSGSLGLGLSLVKKICDTYGFTINYQFENKQHTFTLWLPD